MRPDQPAVWLDPALRGIDRTLADDKIVALPGPSGAGKWTLLNFLGGLDRATAGSVRYPGRERETMDDRTFAEYRRDDVGFTFPFYNLIPSLTAAENVELVTATARASLTPTAGAGTGRTRCVRRSPAW